jgi:NDP-sugar pyrophosphorylase family protein
LELPKPAWPLFDLPLAAHALRRLARAGVEDAIVNLHHLPARLREVLEPWIPEGMRVSWSLEKRILGTGGALLPWRPLLAEGAFFLVNGDTFQDVDLVAMMNQHRKTGAVVTLTLREAAAGAAAPLEVDAAGRVVRFLGARAPGAEPGTPCEFTGTHLLDPTVLLRLPDRPHCINADVHQKLVGFGAPVYGFLTRPEDFWSDLGTPERYLGAHRELLRRGAVPEGCPGQVFAASGRARGGGWVEVPSYLGPDASIGPDCVAGPFAVLGAAARLERGARLSAGVLWAGACLSGEVVGGLIESESGERMTVKLVAEERALPRPPLGPKS